MSKSHLSNKFFLISFIPALAYWYLEVNYSLKIALIGGIALAILELALEFLLFKHTHLISRINFFLILILGGFSFLGEDGIWFKLQPAFTGIGLGTFLIVQKFRGKSLMLQMIKEMQNTPPPEFFVRQIESHMGYFLFFYGLFMGYVAFFLSTDLWLTFKTGGFYAASLIFFIVEILLIRIKIKKNTRKLP